MLPSFLCHFNQIFLGKRCKTCMVFYRLKARSSLKFRPRTEKPSLIRPRSGPLGKVATEGNREFHLEFRLENPPGFPAVCSRLSKSRQILLRSRRQPYKRLIQKWRQKLEKGDRSQPPKSQLSTTGQRTIPPHSKQRHFHPESPDFLQL